MALLSGADIRPPYNSGMVSAAHATASGLEMTDTPKTRAATSNAARLSRRGLMLGGAGIVGALGSGAANAQSWLEQLQGFGNGSSSAPTKVKTASEAEVINDLRTDNIPWRSDVMLDQMDRAIGRYEQIVAKNGWPMVKTGRTLRSGDDDDRIVPARRRLIITGDMKASTSGFGGGSNNLDDYMEAGLKRFQERHGLRINGRLDRPTVEALNVSANARLEQLRLNRRRIQELMVGRIEDRYVLVNAAAYQLEAVENHDVIQRHRTIVGKPDRQTPVIRATIGALNFFPQWRVPQSVAVLDLIPKLRKEPEYLAKEHIRVFNGINGPELDPSQIDWNQADGTKLWFKQDSGDRNALGLVRIDMSNPEGVYMHDTPLKPLFGQRQRPFSAGCVRVQDVFKLTDWIARHEVSWEKTGGSLAVVSNGQPLDVKLTRPLPVYFTYITAWAEKEGTVVFQPDVYGRDGLKEPAAPGADPEAPPPPSGGFAP